MTMTYDIGPPKEAEPDWEEMQIDSVAKRILDQIPDGFVPTILRAMCHAYEQGSDITTNGSNEAVKFLGADDGKGMAFECTIRETEDEHGNVGAPLVEGTIDLYSAGIQISANNVLFTRLPASVMAKEMKGTPVTALVDFPLFDGRLIDNVKTIEDTMLAALERKEPMSWHDTMEGWE